MVKERKDINANYKALFFNGKTLRFKLDPNKEFNTPKTPELEDVAINTKCLANCPYCYVSAVKNGVNYEGIINKANKVWGSLDENERPFQIAIGGAGEPTMHPDFGAFVKRVNELGITPNYTTNGMHLSDDVLEHTKKYCGGVSLSYHPHIKKVFHNAIDKLKNLGVKFNLHIIVGDDGSLDELKLLYAQYKDIVDYFVVLPYQSVGRGKEIDVKNEWLNAFEWIESIDSKKFAFGALYYEFLKENDVNLEMSIYEPEIFSGYRKLDGNYKVLYKSSYDETEK